MKHNVFHRMIYLSAKFTFYTISDGKYTAAINIKNFKKAERESPENMRYTSLCGLETVALTEQQQQKLQVCENNWVR